MSKPSSKPSKIKVQDEPFDLDAMEKEASKHDYRFTLAGRDWTMTPLGRLDRKAIKRLARELKDTDENDTENLRYVELMLAEGMGADQWAEFDELPLSQSGLMALFEDWSEHSGIEAGESSASTDS